LAAKRQSNPHIVIGKAAVRFIEPRQSTASQLSYWTDRATIGGMSVSGFIGDPTAIINRLRSLVSEFRIVIAQANRACRDIVEAARENLVIGEA
jgi:hypothetical protein